MHLEQVHDHRQQKTGGVKTRRSEPLDSPDSPSYEPKSDDDHTGEPCRSNRAPIVLDLPLKGISVQEGAKPLHI